jgi:hypothetical protein
MAMDSENESFISFLFIVHPCGGGGGGDDGSHNNNNNNNI